MDLELREFIVSLAETVAWPVVVIVAVVLFRVRISELLTRLSRFKARGFGSSIELRFTEEVAEALATAIELPPVAAPVTPAESGRLAELAKRSPRAAILEGWLMVTREIQLLGSQLITTPEARRGGRAELERIINAYPFSSSLIFLLERLRNLRNLAVHNLDDVDEGDAISYISIIDRVIPALRDLQPPQPTNRST